MSDTLEWILRLVDRVSGPAHGVVRSLGEMTAASKTLGSVGSYGVDMLSNAMSGLVMTAQLGAVALAGLLLYGAKMAIDASSFKDDMIRSFTLITGTRAAALDTYAAIKAISDKTPFKTNDVMGIFKTLLASGFDQKSAETMFAAMADVAAVQGAAGQEKLQEFSALVSKIVAMDKMTSREMLQLNNAGAQAGVGEGAFLAQVMAAHNVSKDAALKMVEHGQIAGAEALQLIVKAVQEHTDKGGPLGTATKEFGQESYSGALSTFKSRIDELFQDVGIAPVTNLLKFFNEQLAEGSYSGNVLKMAMDELFGDVLGGGAGLIQRTFTPENVLVFLSAIRSAIVFGEDFFKTMSGAWDILSPQIEITGNLLNNLFGTTTMSAGSTFASILITLALAAIYTFDAFVSFVGVLKWTWNTLVFLAHIVGVVLGAIGGSIATFFALLMLPFAIMIDLFTGFGTNLTEGLWKGIKAGWATLLSDFHDLLMLLPEGVKKALNIQSPSRVMFGLGAYTAEGFGEGLRSRPNDFGANALALPSGSAGASSASGAMGGNTYAIEINVSASGSMSDDGASALAVKIRREVEAFFDGIATQAGAPAEVTP